MYWKFIIDFLWHRMRSIYMFIHILYYFTISKTYVQEYFFLEKCLQNEAMTGTHTQNSVFSRITFAMMEDTGWYRADYSHASPLDWGRGLGCRFPQTSCKEWINSQRLRYFHLSHRHHFTTLVVSLYHLNHSDHINPSWSNHMNHLEHINNFRPNDLSDTSEAIRFHQAHVHSGIEQTIWGQLNHFNTWTIWGLITEA